MAYAYVSLHVDMFHGDVSCVFFFGLLEGNAMEWVFFLVFPVLPTQLEASSFKGLMNSAHSQPRRTSAL